MKYLLTFCAVVFLGFSSFAQAPARFNYQAVLYDSNGGSLLFYQKVVMRISILQGSASGPAVYVEEHTTTTTNVGLITIDIGAGKVISGNLSSLAWSKGPYYLKTETDPTGIGSNYSIVGVSQLESVPYALYASAAGHHIGELFEGGIIFYLWHDADGAEHGLIASLQDQGTGVWASPVVSNATIAASHSDGAANTTAIVTQQGAAGASTAAGVCDAYATSTHDDWYLPAIWELNQLYAQVLTINIILEQEKVKDPTITGLDLDEYWSSTIAQQGGTTLIDGAWAQQFRGTSSTDIPGRTHSVSQKTSTPRGIRAIRRF